MRLRILAHTVAAIGIVGIAHGQDLGSLIRRVIREGVNQGKLTIVPPKKATEPSGFPPPRETKDPDPTVPPQNRFYILSSDHTARNGDKVLAEGNVHFFARGYEVWCDQVVGDLRTEVYTMKGHVVVRGLDQDVAGEEVTLDNKAKTLAYRDSIATLGPKFLQGNFKSDLYVQGDSGRGSKLQFFVNGTHVTTCNLPVPHYELIARSVDVKPGKRAILRDSTLRILDRKILSIPYLVIPLSERNDRFTPEAGYTRDEGYYVKTRFSTPVHGDDYLDNHVDYYTRRGKGLGQDFHYDSRVRQGVLKYYTILGPQRTDLVSLNHKERLFGGLLTVDGLYQKNNYLTSSNAKQTSLRAGYLLNSRDGTTRFSFTRFSNSSANFGSRQQTYGLNDDRRWSSNFRTTVDLNISKNDSASSSVSPVTREQANVNLRAIQEFRAGTANLEYVRNIPIGQRTDFIGVSDRTPQLSFTTDSRRLFGSRFGEQVPLRAEASWGELVDSVKRDQVNRSFLDLALNRTFKFGTRTTVGLDSRFRQGVYSDDTAQWVLGNNLNFRYDFGAKSSWNLRYNYLRPHGYTPLNIDRSGRAHEASTDFTYQIWDSFGLGAQTAYSLYSPETSPRTHWQTVGLRSTYSPNRRFLVRTLSNYDPFNKLWSDQRIDLSWRLNEGFFSAGARYDGQRHTWASVNTIIDGITLGKLKMSALLSYNGYSKKFDARHFSFTYDLHDAEAILQVIDNPIGYRSGTQIQLFIRLKALPFDTPFGIGQRGQAVGTGTGYKF